MPHVRICAALLGVLPALCAPVRGDEEVTAWRVFVADHAAPRVTAIDLDAPDRRWTFDLAGPARLYAASSGALVTAVQSDADRDDFLHTGIRLDDHGDHADIDVSDPETLGSIEGPRPFHVVDHGGTVAIAFDRGGYAAVLDAGAVAAGTVAPFEVPMNVAHHGFVAPVGEHYVTSVASEAPVAADEAPPRVGIAAIGSDGVRISEMGTCTDLHGEAFSGDYLLAGCREGIVALDTTAGPDAFEMMPYPEDFPEGRTGTLLGAGAMQIFLGNYGRDSVVIVDPAAEPHFTRVELPFRRVDFVLDPARPETAYVLTEDGTIHRLDMLSAEIEASAGVTGPYPMDGHRRDPRPRMAVAGDRLILSDPSASVLRIVDTETLEETGTVPVEGVPYNVAVAGGSGVAH